MDKQKGIIVYNTKADRPCTPAELDYLVEKGILTFNYYARKDSVGPGRVWAYLDFNKLTENERVYELQEE